MATTEDRISARVASRKPMSRSLVVRVSDELHERLKHLTEKVAARHGTKVTVSDVARAVLEEATAARGLPASAALVFPNFDLAEAERMIEEGQSVAAVAKHFGMSEATLKKYRRFRIG